MILQLLVSLFLSSVHAQGIGSATYLEPQFVTPQGDAEFLDTLDLPNPTDSEWVNYLFVAQDRRGPRSAANRRTRRETGGSRDAEALASRADIILVLSLNKSTSQWVVFSIYRGARLKSFCSAPRGRHLADGEDYMANFYYMDGRKHFIPCIQEMIRRRLRRSPSLQERYELDPDEFFIHGFFEGTKETTLNPLARSILSVARNNMG